MIHQYLEKVRGSGQYISLLAIVAVLVFGASTALAATTTVDLGTAGNFVILAKSGISTTGTTSIVGDIGVSPIDSTAITGFGLIMDPMNKFSRSSLVTGNVYAANYAPPTPTKMTTAVNNMETAYSDAAGRSPDATELGAGDIGGMTLAPGIYKWSTGVTIPTDVTLSGSSTDVWIFQIAGNLDITADMKVNLEGGASDCNIFWAVAGTTTLKPGSTFEGNILAGPATSTIALQNGATLNGRALGQKDVTLIANKITASACSVPPGPAIPEFPTVALPVIAVIGLLYMFQRRNGK